MICNCRQTANSFCFSRGSGELLFNANSRETNSMEVEEMDYLDYNFNHVDAEQMIMLKSSSFMRQLFISMDDCVLQACRIWVVTRSRNSKRS